MRLGSRAPLLAVCLGLGGVIWCGGGFDCHFGGRGNPLLAGGCPCTPASAGRVSGSSGGGSRSRAPVDWRDAFHVFSAFVALKFSLCPPHRGASRGWMMEVLCGTSCGSPDPMLACGACKVPLASQLLSDLTRSLAATPAGLGLDCGSTRVARWFCACLRQRPADSPDRTSLLGRQLRLPGRCQGLCVASLTYDFSATSGRLFLAQLVLCFSMVVLTCGRSVGPSLEGFVTLGGYVSMGLLLPQFLDERRAYAQHGWMRCRSMWMATRDYQQH